jgi:hypothetical protein
VLSAPIIMLFIFMNFWLQKISQHESCVDFKLVNYNYRITLNQKRLNANTFKFMCAQQHYWYLTFCVSKSEII